MSPNKTTEIECAVYKSIKKDETYVFIPTTKPLSDLPEELLKVLGQAEIIMTLKLTPEKKMARGTAAQVMKSIEERGFHLQMPEKPHINAVPSYGETLEDKNIS
jgi:uncharacterized protein YcgL (UPF0745 family)